jgi:hypothetical protein
MPEQPEGQKPSNCVSCKSNGGQPFSWDEVGKQERKLITERRTAREEKKSDETGPTKNEKETGKTQEAKEAENLVGLSFSGGGIRSATFNLGVLQGLAANKLLRKIDYLSSVSGGSYINSTAAQFSQRPHNSNKYPFHGITFTSTYLTR